MFAPPKLMPGDLSDLVCRVGGKKPAARLLGVTAETLADWERREEAPEMALRLLWYHGPDGQAAADDQVHRQLELMALERDALREEVKKARALVDERRAALGARVIALQVENRKLRQLSEERLPLGEIKEVSAQLLGMLQALDEGEPRSLAGEGVVVSRRVRSVPPEAQLGSCRC